MQTFFLSSFILPADKRIAAKLLSCLSRDGEKTRRYGDERETRGTLVGAYEFYIWGHCVRLRTLLK